MAFAFTLATTLGFLSVATAFAEANNSQITKTQQNQLSPEQDNLVRIVRSSTERFKDVSVAEAEGYHLLFGCVTGPDAGAMGLHFANQAFLQNPPMTPDGKIDPTKPQIVIYEPIPGEGLRLIGADYLLDAATWDKAHPQDPPQLNGQLFHFFESPNRFALPAFYTLHVWAWKENPNGAFVNWHPDVSCQSFTGQQQ